MGAATTPLCVSADQSFWPVSARNASRFPCAVPSNTRFPAVERTPPFTGLWRSARPISLFLTGGIPSGKMALDGAEDGFLDFRLLRHACGHEVDPGVECQIALLGTLVRFVKEPRVLDGDVG